MKRINATIVGLVGGMLLIAAGNTGAQICGLPVADSFEAREDGAFDLTAGASFASVVKFYGVRDTFACTENSRLFVDVGVADPHAGENDLALQGGMVAGIPATDLPVALGVRGAVYGMNADEFEVFGGNLLALASKEMLFEGLFFYGGVGLDYRRVKIGIESETTKADYEYNGVLTAGALIPFTAVSEHLFFFTELTVTDYTFIGLGLRYR
jgi:hypothetical protein